MMIKHIVTAIATLPGIAGLTHCDGANTPPARPAQHIYIPYEYDAPFDAQPGDTITLIMPAYETGWVALCDDAGGEPIYNPYTGIATCDDVDF